MRLLILSYFLKTSRLIIVAGLCYLVFRLWPDSLRPLGLAPFIEDSTSLVTELSG